MNPTGPQVPPPSICTPKHINATSCAGSRSSLEPQHRSVPRVRLAIGDVRKARIAHAGLRVRTDVIRLCFLYGVVPC